MALLPSLIQLVFFYILCIGLLGEYAPGVSFKRLVTALYHTYLADTISLAHYLSLFVSSLALRLSSYVITELVTGRQIRMFSSLVFLTH